MPVKPPVATGRPRVLLADDDAGILKAVSRTLAIDFEVVTAVSDGRQALDSVARLDPDAVVLDISMPGLNGLQTAQELKRSGSRAKIVFLTMHQDDELVSDAIRCGASGYVLKTFAPSELTEALHDALAGRRHLPSLTPLVMADIDAHAVQFCGENSSWLDGVANLLSRALRRGDAVANILTGSNRDALARRMHERGWNLADLGAQGRYSIFDAEETATHFMQAGTLDIDRVADRVATLDSARVASGALHLTIVGEGVDILCRRGNPEAAVELERLWHELTRPLPILTICTYQKDCVDPAAAPGLISAICAHHSVVSHAVHW
jgi:DNA-binding NarL/FixJ family response regulator